MILDVGLRGWALVSGPSLNSMKRYSHVPVRLLRNEGTRCEPEKSKCLKSYAEHPKDYTL